MSFKSALGAHHVQEEAVIKIENIVVDNIPVFGSDGKMRDSGVSLAAVNGTNGGLTEGNGIDISSSIVSLDIFNYSTNAIQLSTTSGHLNLSAFTSMSLNASGGFTAGGDSIYMQSQSNGITLETWGGAEQGINLTANDGYVCLTSTDGSYIDNNTESISIDSDGILIENNNGANGIILSSTANGITIDSTQDMNMSANRAFYTDSSGTNGGIKYAADYSASFTERSLVDKNYVDSLALNLYETNFANLVTLQNGSNFIPGLKYKITHQTKHVIPNTPSSVIHTGSTETLILEAVSKTQLSIRAISVDYPYDIIHFDFNDRLCEDNTTVRDGKIIYREYTKNNISTHYDFRNVKFRRWEVINGSFVFESVTDTGFGFADYYTFEDSQNPVNSKNIRIGKSYTSSYNNNLIQSNMPVTNIFFAENCHDNFIGQACNNNIFGMGCNGNNLRGNNENNFFGNNCDSNRLAWGCSGNRFGNNCFNNVIANGTSTSGDYDNNDLGNNCNNNVIRGNDNKLESSCAFIEFNQVCNNNYFCSGIQNKEFNGTLNSCKFLITTTSVETINNSYTNIVVDMMDGNNIQWYRTIDTLGAMSTNTIS